MKKLLVVRFAIGSLLIGTAFAGPVFAEEVVFTKSSTQDSVSDHARDVRSDGVLQLEAHEQADKLRSENETVSQEGPVPMMPLPTDYVVPQPIGTVQPDLTPLDQSNAPADLTLTQRIRQGLMAQETLSVDAKNIKVITVDGKVTLRGVVQNSEEKSRVENMVQDMAGPENTICQIEVREQ